MSLKSFLFKNEAVDGINKPSDYLYIKILRFTLLVVGSWPRKEIGEPEPYYQEMSLKLFYVALTIGCMVGFISYVIIHISELSFLEVGHMYIVILMSIVIVSRDVTLTCSTKYRAVAKEFLTKIHLLFFIHRSKYALKFFTGRDAAALFCIIVFEIVYYTHKMIHLISHLFTLFLVMQMLLGLSLFNLIPMYNNYAAGRYKSERIDNSTFEHSLYLPYPFNTSTEIKGYVFACILHWFLSYLCATWFCMFDLFLSLMVFNLWGHFKILINLLNDFPKPSLGPNFTTENGFVIRAEKYSKEELRQVSERLAECIIYHREIVNFTNTMSDVFGPMLFVYYLFHQTSGCLLLLECSQMTTQALMRYVPLTIILTQQLIQLSVIFELVGSESDKLKHAVYGVPWEAMDSKNRKVVAIFLMNTQEPVHVKALGVADVGVTSMAMILKTSVSYFTFLRTV